MQVTREDASRLAEAIAETPDAGAWHVHVIVAPDGQGYAVAVRQHRAHELHTVCSLADFTRLCDRLPQA